MKQWCLLLLMLFPLFAGAQVISYDTIRVSSDDERNIYSKPLQKPSTQKEPAMSQRSYLPQEMLPAFDRSKLRFGANVGLSLSRNYTRLGLGPQIGYQFNRYFMTGTGIKYYYTKAALADYTIRNNLLGVNVFGYVSPVRFITAFAQPEINYIRSVLTEKATGVDRTNRGFVPSLVVGAGLQVGRSHITLNYDLVQHVNSPHPSGFYLGFSAFF